MGVGALAIIMPEWNFPAQCNGDTQAIMMPERNFPAQCDGEGQAIMIPPTRCDDRQPPIENAKIELPMIPYEMQAPDDLTCLEALDMYDGSNQATETRSVVSVEGAFPIQ